MCRRQLIRCKSYFNWCMYDRGFWNTDLGPPGNPFMPWCGYMYEIRRDGLNAKSQTQPVEEAD
jgi:hypothetical protein